VPEFGFTNLYGTDVTGLRAIDRFPNENPNPVLRVAHDGTLTYANPASAPVRLAFRAEVGQRVDPAMWQRLEAAAADPEAATIEVESGDRLFSLKVVSLYEFDSINVYGTDITAAREVERLLLNILPASIADRLRAGERVIADRFDDMAVLFADVVNFTPFAHAHPPGEVVEVLNAVFSIFDQLADDYGLEKIKTIGDAYMVAGGIGEEGDGPERVARMGLEMIERLRAYRTEQGTSLEIRVGMHVGPAIGGVIGLKKFIYDVWGDTVNTASRMESHGLPGRVQVTDSARRRLEHAFTFEPRGLVDVKGQGPMETYLLVGPAA
jgi:class 3 adenylate cyclase